MRSQQSSRCACRLTGAVCVLLFAAANAHSGTVTWAGAASSSWNAAGNWTTVPPGGVPQNGDSLVFDAAAPANNPSNNNLTNLLVHGIAFDAGAATQPLGGNAVSLGVETTATGITHAGDVVNNSSNSQTVGVGATLDAGKHLITTGTAALNLSGPINQSKGSIARFTNGGGGINVAGSGLANDSSGILGGWATIGTDWAALDGSSNVVPYAGYVDVAGGGTIADGANTNVRINAGSATAITMAAAGTTNINTLSYRAGSGTQTVTIGASNTLVLGQNGGIFNSTADGGTFRQLTIGAAGVGTVTAGDGVNPANITLTGTPFGTANAVQINSSVTNNDLLGNNTPVSLTLAGQNFTLSGNGNTYTGGTYILSGRLSNPNQAQISTGPVYIFAGGQINDQFNLTNDFLIAGIAIPKITASAHFVCSMAPSSRARLH